WAEFRRSVPSGGPLRRSHPQGREAGGPSGAGAEQVRIGDQPQDRESVRPHCAAIASRQRQRRDRVSGAMSAFGPKRTSLVAQHMSAFGGKADIGWGGAYVGL